MHDAEAKKYHTQKKKLTSCQKPTFLFLPAHLMTSRCAINLREEATRVSRFLRAFRRQTQDVRHPMISSPVALMRWIAPLSRSAAQAKAFSR